jgi:hypothetical protein
VPNGEVELAAVDPAQALLMAPKWADSTSQPKKLSAAKTALSSVNV